jgi:hypothetical protein
MPSSWYKWNYYKSRISYDTNFGILGRFAKKKLYTYGSTISYRGIQGVVFHRYIPYHIGSPRLIVHSITMDQEQQQRPQQQRQQHQKPLHPVISDLCYHLSKSCNDDDDYAPPPTPPAPTTAVPPPQSPGGGPHHQRPGPRAAGGAFPPPRGGKSSPVPLPVAAIRVLLDVIRRSGAETMMGLQAELRDASDVMVDFARGGGRSRRRRGRRGTSSRDGTTSPCLRGASCS